MGQNKNDYKVEICFLSGLENDVGKGENAGCQHCHLYPPCFLYFYTPTWIDWGHIVFGLFVHLSVCLSAKTFTLAISFDW